MMSKKKKRVVTKVFNTLLTLIFIFLVICLGWVFAHIVTGQPPSLFGYNAYTVLTESMEPTIMTGDVIITKKINDSSEVQIDDVITFIAPEGFADTPQLEGKYITHRVVDINLGEGYVITKGDNPRASVDIPIPIENIVAKYKYTSKAIKGLINVISNPFGFMGIVIVPLLVVLIWQVLALVKSKERQRNSDIELLTEEEMKKQALKEVMEKIEKDKQEEIKKE